MAIKAGIYKHFKGKYYTVYCIACDCNNSSYVLYQQNYGDKSFWLRPYDMFFESVMISDGSEIPRFSFKGKEKPIVEQIKKLISLLNEQKIFIRNTEDEEPFSITEINESLDYVMVTPLSYSYSSGYLTEYELAQRMGYNLCLINNKQVFFKKTDTVPDTFALSIGDNELKTLADNLNPCSIDLKIADSGYLTTKRKLVDPQSIEHISKASDLWKSVHVYSSKNKSSKYIRLKPGMIVLTHTKELIKIPKDCAAKIEIKSTFARLSLSITTGDFCNPGYKGYYPLEIKNNGKHTIILHEGETMAQLMLLPLQGPILNEYSRKATFINNKGYDDGTPYSFWKERSIKALRKKDGTQLLLNLYQEIMNSVDNQTTEDVNGFKERFSNNFLPYCQKHLDGKALSKSGDNTPDAKKLLLNYIRKEKLLKSFLMIKWGAVLLSIISAILPNMLTIVQLDENMGIIQLFIHFFWPWLFVSIILAIIAISLFIFSPKVFCTFEKYDIDKAIKKIQSQDTDIS